MAIQINFQEDNESVKELAVMLAAIEGSDQLDGVQSSVVDSVLTSCYEQDTSLNPDIVEEEAEELKRRLYTGWV